MAVDRHRSISTARFVVRISCSTRPSYAHAWRVYVWYATCAVTEKSPIAARDPLFTPFTRRHVAGVFGIIDRKTLHGMAA